MAEQVQYVISLKDLFSSNIKNCITQVKSLESGITGVKSSLGGIKSALAGAFALAGGSALGIEIIQTTAKMESLTNAITFASGSAQEGSKNMSFLKDTAAEMGLPLEGAINGFKTLSAAMIGSKLQGQGARDVFKGVSSGIAVMGLSSEQAEGAYLALGQMMSKGKVQAEELRGQLGERIPGAFQIAARAMHMTTAQLDKFMSDGKLVATDFLPKFAKEMQKTFGGGVANASKSLQANLNRLSNEFLLLKTEVGNELYPVIIKLIGGLRGLMPMVRDGIKFIKEHAGAFKILAEVLGSIVAGNLFFKLVTGVKALSFSLTVTPIALYAAAFAGLVFMIMEAKKAYDIFNQDRLMGDVNSRAKGYIEEEKHAVEDLAATYQKFRKLNAEDSKKLAISDEIKRVKENIAEIQKQFNGISGNTPEKQNLTHILMAKKKALEYLNGDEAISKNGTYGKDSTAISTTPIDKVHGGGIQNLTINIDKLVDGLNINTTNITESKQKLRDIILETLTTAVRDGGIMARN